MRVVLLRVDSRLVHGQVIEAWLPFLNTRTIVVIDDTTSESLVLREVMKMAVPPGVDLFFSTLEELKAKRDILGADDRRVLLLCKDLKAALSIVRSVPGIDKVNLGNLHYATGKKEVSPSVFLDDTDLVMVGKIRELGVKVDVKTVPTDMNARI